MTCTGKAYENAPKSAKRLGVVNLSQEDDELEEDFDDSDSWEEDFDDDGDE